jgi:hypothetical protein
MLDIGFVVAGFVVGVIVGLTGVGGGSLMTPILIYFFGIKPQLAVGTDLLFAAFTKCSGTVNMARQKLVPWRVVGQLCLGSIPAAFATLWVLHQFSSDAKTIETAIKTTLGWALMLTAVATLYKAIKGSAKVQGLATNEAQDATKARHWSLPIIFGALIGTMVTMTSVGAGAIGVTVLMLLYPQLPLPRIVAADIAYAVPLTLVAGLGHAHVLDSVDWQLLGTLLVGSLPGIWIGSQLTNRTPERLIRGILSVLLAWAGSKLLMI